MKKTLLLSSLLMGISFLSFSQISMPAASPAASVSQKIGIAEAKIEYSRPSVKGRKIFGDLLPYNSAWRTGANGATKFTITDTLIIAGKKLAPASYAIYTIPAEKEWTVIIGKNANTQVWDHKEENDAVRFKVASEKTPAFVETFSISFENVTPKSSDLVLAWENTSIKFKIENDADAKIMADLKSRMENVEVYWQAANYYYENNKDLKEALNFVNKYIEKNPRFWTLHLKAKILVKLKDCKGAKEAALKSIELAKADKNDDYVKMNEKLIADCK